jgi:hypothetical protein
MSTSPSDRRLAAVRVRARHADGTTSAWEAVEAGGAGAESPRTPVVALFRIGLTDAGDGRVEVANLNPSRPVSEPGAVLRLTNLRTGEQANVTLTGAGGFPPGVVVGGKAGDTLAIAVSDGLGNAGLATAAGNVRVPGGTPGTTDLVPDPAPHRDELDPLGASRFGKTRFTGPLFAGVAKPAAVRQGQLGDCYLPAALASIASADPDAIEHLIRDEGDGTYTVTFHQKDWATGTFRAVPVKVDGDLYTRPSGAALYGHSASGPDPRTMELWFPLVEKAYAQWKGGYDAIGNGGTVGDVIEDCLGIETGYATIGATTMDRAWDLIVTTIDSRKPVGAGTWSEDHDGRYTNSGVYADHAYSVLRYEQGGGGRYVVLRNPWGPAEQADPTGDDGVIKLELARFAALYQSLYFGK